VVCPPQKISKSKPIESPWKKPKQQSLITTFKESLEGESRMSKRSLEEIDAEDLYTGTDVDEVVIQFVDETTGAKQEKIYKSKEARAFVNLNECLEVIYRGQTKQCILDVDPTVFETAIEATTAAPKPTLAEIKNLDKVLAFLEANKFCNSKLDEKWARKISVFFGYIQNDSANMGARQELGIPLLLAAKKYPLALSKTLQEGLTKLNIRLDPSSITHATIFLCEQQVMDLAPFFADGALPLPPGFQKQSVNESNFCKAYVLWFSNQYTHSHIMALVVKNSGIKGGDGVYNRESEGLFLCTETIPYFGAVDDTPRDANEVSESHNLLFMDSDIKHLLDADSEVDVDDKYWELYVGKSKPAGGSWAMWGKHNISKREQYFWVAHDSGNLPHPPSTGWRALEALNQVGPDYSVKTSNAFCIENLSL
jgi:hypothetical protein